ncbi:helix-turn-helix transcriptional regulator [Sphingomonas azotifigens]|uniref:helix-turn-helix transcriptional regulator n=1 Tax=Sphingomonas azotifigens TaxID=330920 RepID=UPI000A025D2D|nr:autoinducer binding domain-containing protein [Sphingomonas azotifigens]
MHTIHNATSLEGLSNALADMMRPFGINAFAFGQIPAASRDLGELSLIRWPRWIEHYAINGFAYHDSAIDEMQVSREPFTWSELKFRRPEKGGRVFEACSAFGWNDGFIIPIDQCRGFVSLAAPSSLQGWDSAQRSEVTAVATAAYVKSLSFPATPAQSPRRLSAREQEALSLVALGMSDADIARVIDVSTSTAHAHVERAKRRLGAKTRAHAVALALRAKMI